MPKERGMVFPYTKRGQEDAQKYREALSPEQEQMKRALTQSILGQAQAIQQGIKQVQREVNRREILEMIKGNKRKQGVPTPYKKGGKVKKKY